MNGGKWQASTLRAIKKTFIFIMVQMKVNPFVLSKIFARRPKGVGNKQGLWLLFGARLIAFMRPLWLILSLIYMTKKAVS
ncbi:MAG: hypothetical protein WC091_18000 [Sulfuricellaceae bacterium]